MCSSDLRTFLEKANYNVERVKDAYNYILTKRNVKDFVSYMIDAINHGYAAKPVYRSDGRFNDRINNRNDDRSDDKKDDNYDDRVDSYHENYSTARNHLVVEEGSQISFADLEQEDVSAHENARMHEPERMREDSEKEPEAMGEESTEADAMALEIISGMKDDAEWKRFVNQLELPYELVLKVKGAKWLLWQFSSWKKEV